MELRRALTVLAAASLIPLAASCGPAPTSAPGTTTDSSTSISVAAAPVTSAVSLSETGSTLLYSLFSAWGPAYHQKYPNVTLSTEASGSGAGIAQVAAGAIDIGGSDAYLAEGEAKAHPGLMNIALAISAQQVTYNLPGAPEHLRLNGKVLSGMYSGAIKTWSDPAIAALNPGVSLPDTRVVPLHRSDGSGDTFLFTQYLAKQDPDGWGKTPGFGTTVDFPALPTAVGQDSNGAMVTGCAENPGCIAYASIGLRDQVAQKGLGVAQLGNAAGSYLLPESDNIRSGAAGFAAQTPDNQAISLIDGPASDGYPIINYEYAIVNAHQSDPATAQTLQAFLQWAVTDGNAPAFLDQVDLQPLPEQVAKSSIAQIAKISAD